MPIPLSKFYNKGDVRRRNVRKKLIIICKLLIKSFAMNIFLKIYILVGPKFRIDNQVLNYKIQYTLSIPNTLNVDYHPLQIFLKIFVMVEIL